MTSLPTLDWWGKGAAFICLFVFVVVFFLPMPNFMAPLSMRLIFCSQSFSPFLVCFTETVRSKFGNKRVYPRGRICVQKVTAAACKASISAPLGHEILVYKVSKTVLLELAQLFGQPLSSAKKLAVGIGMSYPTLALISVF